MAEREQAVAKRTLTGKAVADFSLEEMPADPMIRLVMRADGVKESELRVLSSDVSEPQADRIQNEQTPAAPFHSQDAGEQTHRTRTAVRVP